MAKKNQTQKIQKSTVSKEAMFVVAFIALIAGFLGGIIFSSYKTGSGTPAETEGPAGPGSPPRGQGFSPAKALEIPDLEKAASANPGSAQTWVLLGNAYFDTNQYEKAIVAYEKSLAIAPGNADVLTDMGVMYRRNGQPKKAVECFDRAMAADPRHEISRLNKGIVLLHDLNDRGGAFQAWEDLLKINPFARAPNGQPLMDFLKEARKN